MGTQSKLPSQSPTHSQQKSNNNDAPKHSVNKPPRIQWQAIRDLVKWKALPKHISNDEVHVIQNAIKYESFENHSKCRVDIPRESMNPELTKFIRRHRREDAKMVLSYWLRMMDITMTADICDIVSGTVFEDDRFIYGKWIVREEVQSSKDRCENQSRFFKELQSISDGDGSENIMGATITFVTNARGGYSKTSLYLNANGQYLFNLNGRSSGIKHCGVWDYQGDEIAMQGVGYRFQNHPLQFFQYRFLSKLAIQRPVPFNFEDLSVVLYF